jgi:hypothetical protein
MIGETPEQFEHGKPTHVKPLNDVGVIMMIWEGKTVAHIGAFENGKASMESFVYRDTHKMNGTEISKFLQPYAIYRHTDWDNSVEGLSFAAILDKQGKAMFMAVYESSGNILSVWRPDRFMEAFPEIKSKQSDDRKDCLIVASELNDRMKKTSTWWNQIIIYDVFVDGIKERQGHAVAGWKYSPDGHVYIGDITGSAELETSSEDIDVIMATLSASQSAKSGKHITLKGHFAQ